MKLKKIINKVVLESGFIFIRESKKEGEGDCSMQGGGGQGKKEFLFELLAWGEGFLEHGVWALIQGKTKVYHRVRLEDADSPIVATMKNLFTRFF